MERKFFLKYGDYRRGLRLRLYDGPLRGYKIDYDAEPEKGDERFEGVRGAVHLLERLRELYPDSYSMNGVPQGEVHFAGILYSLNESVGRRYRRTAAARRRQGRGK